jgi:transcriptional regulator with XRE-family HTH domain
VDLGTQIKTARQMRGLTPRELADQLGIPLRTLHAWEANETLPASRDLAALNRHLAAALQISGPTAARQISPLATFVVERARERGYRSLRDFGTAAGVSPETIRQIERGGRLPRLETLGRLADALDVDLERLRQLAGVDYPPFEAPLRWRLLSAEERVLLLRLADLLLQARESDRPAHPDALGATTGDGPAAGARRGATASS